MRQDACAARAKISASYLANIEAGRKHPPILVASRLAGTLGVPLDAITYPASPPPQAPLPTVERRDHDGDRRSTIAPTDPPPPRVSAPAGGGAATAGGGAGSRRSGGR